MEPFVGQISLFASEAAPRGWAPCHGQLLSITENQPLFSLLGTTYGGDGQETFALPDLRGRLPMHFGNEFILAETGGVEEVTLTVQQTPAHTHPMLASQNTGTGSNPGGNVLDQMSGAILMYKAQPATAALSPKAVGGTGGSQPHTNFQPYLCINFIISLFGIFPTQS